MAAAKSQKRVCATCTHCDVRNNGYCENEDVRKVIEFDGIITDPDEFGCTYWSARKDKESD